jgi:hypothetical protein
VPVVPINSRLPRHAKSHSAAAAGWNTPGKAKLLVGKLISQADKAQIMSRFDVKPIVWRKPVVPRVISIPFLSSLLATDANLST